MKKNYKYMLFCILLLATILSCGAGKKNFVILDTDNHIMYKNVAIDTIIQDYNKDEKGFASKYDKQYLVVWGNVEEISDNAKSFTIKSLDGNNIKLIECTTKDKSIIDQISKLEKNTSVKVYGQVSISSIKKNINIDITKLESVNNIIHSDNLYTSINGFNYDVDNMPQVTLEKGNITYQVPQEWKSVEKPLQNGKLNGFQYNLNEINQTTTKAETLFIFYFDSEKCLKNQNDKTKTQEIQVAIINNILKKEADTKLDFDRKDFKTYYGAIYNYYCDTYSTSSQTYRVEFIFETVDSENIIVYLYVVNNENDKRHIDDIMMVMKTTE